MGVQRKMRWLSGVPGFPQDSVLHIVHVFIHSMNIYWVPTMWQALSLGSPPSPWFQPHEDDLDFQLPIRYFPAWKRKCLFLKTTVKVPVYPFDFGLCSFLKQCSYVWVRSISREWGVKSASSESHRLKMGERVVLNTLLCFTTLSLHPYYFHCLGNGLSLFCLTKELLIVLRNPAQ